MPADDFKNPGFLLKFPIRVVEAAGVGDEFFQNHIHLGVREQDRFADFQCVAVLSGQGFDLGGACQHTRL